LEIYLKRGYNMTKEHYYNKKIQIGLTKSGKPNYYYEQNTDQRNALAAHILTVIGFFSERTAGFEDERDWKIYNQESGKEVQWATGQHKHNPSVRCLWAQLTQQIAKQYAGNKARISEYQIANFNRSIQVTTKLYNSHITGVHKITADHYKIEMVELTLKTGSNPFEEHFVFALKN